VCRGWEFFNFIDEWSTEFNFDGLQLWDSVDTFQHYPGGAALSWRQAGARWHASPAATSCAMCIAAAVFIQHNMTDLPQFFPPTDPRCALALTAAVTQEHLKRYSSEKHEDFWLKGANDPRYQEQLRQKEAAAAAAATADAAAKQEQQQQVAAAAAAANAAAAAQQQAAEQQQAAAGIAAAHQQAAGQQQTAAGAAAGGQQALAAVQQEQAAAETQQQVAALQQQVAATVAHQ
jgi:hypothetical protein